MERKTIEDFRLRVFAAVVLEGGFSSAARKLGVSQAAVSQNIAELESATGVKLFDRSREGVTLTPFGELFKTYADKILFWYDRIDCVFVKKTEAPDTPTLLDLDSEGRRAEISVVDGQLCIKLK